MKNKIAILISGHLRNVSENIGNLYSKLIIPISSTLIGLVDYVIAAIIVLGLMIYYKITPTIYILLIPVIMFFTWVLAAGLGFWFSALNVKYRDTRHIVFFLTQSLMFMTPVIYPVSIFHCS